VVQTPANDYLQYEYHTNFKSTQAKIRTPEEGFNLWMPRHNELKNRVRKKPVDLLMIGDSIVFRWERQGKKIWDEFYGKRRAVQIGSSGDYTDHILWRLQNGAVSGAKPKLTVLLIGTNNTGHEGRPMVEHGGAVYTSSAEETAEGVTAIVEMLQKKQPEMKILILAIFPRGADSNDAKRQKNEKANHIIAKLADDKTVYFMDINDKFLEKDGTLSKEIMPDLLHPNAGGYEIWSKAIQGKVKELMAE
jgi:lysophospholipase L1-like esterase